jgi:hypothetical protein
MHVGTFGGKKSVKSPLLTIGLCLLAGGCAPGGGTGFQSAQYVRPVETIDRPPPTSSPAARPIQLLDGTAPPIENCEAWKEIDRKLYRAPLVNAPQNNVIGDTIQQIQKRGWPEDAAKQLFVVMLASYSNQGITEDQFVAAQFESCKRETSKPGPKYPNVTVASYWSAEKKAAAEEDFNRTQHEFMRRNQMLGPCLQYKSQAMMVQLYKNKGMSAEQAADFITPAAYGPGGIAYRGSQDTEALLVRLIRAGYTLEPKLWRNEQGQPTNNFADFAFARCIKGDPF